jgi:hypothetical protein
MKTILMVIALAVPGVAMAAPVAVVPVETQSISVDTIYNDTFRCWFCRR